MNRILVLLTTSLILIGCSSLPNVEIGYYLPKGAVTATITKTINCSDIERPFVKTDVVFTPTYFADLTQRRYLDYSLLDEFHSAGNIEMKFYGDGRLKAINSDFTGSGSDVLSTLQQIGDAQLMVCEDGGVSPSDISDACKIINKVAGQKSKVQLPLTLILKAKFTEDDNGEFCTSAMPKLQGYPEEFYTSIAPAVGTWGYSCSNITDPEKPGQIIGKNSEDESKDKIAIREDFRVRLSIESTNYMVVKKTVLVDEKKQTQKNVEQQTQKFVTYVNLPQLGNITYLPVPKPPLFGNNVMVLNLSESGKIESLKYGNSSGASSVNSTMGTLIKTDAEKAAEISAQSDLIIQQQRLVQCQADPANCK